LFVETNPAPSKWVMAQRGLISSDHVRAPLITPTESGQLKIKALLEAGRDYLTPTDGFQMAEGKDHD
jgi:4-hydroxy-tetrahydrodipicolinate synthase